MLYRSTCCYLVTKARGEHETRLKRRPSTTTATTTTFHNDPGTRSEVFHVSASTCTWPKPVLSTPGQATGLNYILQCLPIRHPACMASGLLYISLKQTNSRPPRYTIFNLENKLNRDEISRILIYKFIFLMSDELTIKLS